jgi:hypothetical protein
VARAFRFILRLAVFLFAAAVPLLAQDEIFAVNGLGYVVVQGRTLTGNVAPIRVLTGGSTGLAGPVGIAVDTTHNELIVSNVGGSVTVYTRLALGDAAPLRSISGAATGLATPGGLALDLTHNEIFVTNRGSSANSVTVYSRTASGNVAPVRTIAGPDTGLNTPGSVTLDLANGEIYVTSPVLNAVQVFARTDSGDVAPKRMLVGAGTNLQGPWIAVPDPAHDELYVTNSNGNSVTVYPRTASGDTAPTRTIAGAATLMDTPRGLSLNAATEELVVANFGTIANGSVTTFARTASGNATPLRSLSGDATFLHNLQDLDVTNAIATGFTPVAPCRVVDTRRTSGPLGGPALNPFADRSFTIAGQCGIPVGARAVAFNFTVTQPNRNGDLRVFPGAANPPIVSSLNWRPGETRANNAVLQLGEAGDITTRVDEDGGSVHFIVDVMGYFR